MNLTSDWRRIARHAWSLRLAVLAGIFSAAEVLLPLFMDTMPRGIFAGLSMAAAIGGAVARVVAQPKMERRSKPRPKFDGARADYD